MKKDVMIVTGAGQISMAIARRVGFGKRIILGDKNMKNCETIMETREHYGRKLRELGFEMPDSRTNFFFARHPEIPGEELYLALKKRGILVRHFTLERIRDYNRITVGTPEQMEKLIGTIKQILEERVS